MNLAVSVTHLCASILFLNGTHDMNGSTVPDYQAVMIEGQICQSFPQLPLHT